jgi:hypothetical protein
MRDHSRCIDALVRTIARTDESKPVQAASLARFSDMVATVREASGECPDRHRITRLLRSDVFAGLRSCYAGRLGYLVSLAIAGCAQQAGPMPPQQQVTAIANPPAVPSSESELPALATTPAVQAANPVVVSVIDPPSATSTASPSSAEPTPGPSTLNTTTNPPSAASPPSVKAALRPEPLDLTAWYQTPARAFDQIQKYPWRDVPKGSQTFHNVPVEIGGMICLWGSVNTDRGLVFPEKVEGIKAGRTFDSLYLYHATFHSAPEGTPFVTVVFHCDDGSTVENDICYGTNVRDWYQSAAGPEELTDPNSKLAWSGINTLSTTDPKGKLQFFITEIANPLPEAKVVTIDLVSLKERPASCILAITTGPAGLLNAEPAPESKTPAAGEEQSKPLPPDGSR